ncbi:response regulator transcription factor [Methylocaldum sp.]|uniref:response regulator transcription factor n=1 Tax=Methylocaldum sp. TaxID=1969727 RepID=UPI002D527F45|nr:response regulator transcription factor [Methylocaldum sp.]HYE36150.1 response regulator transcription factor [Methylocaldum sp.]
MNSTKSAPENPSPSLLLVDDDPTFCGVLKQALEKRGFEVHAAQDIEAGVSLAEHMEPEYAVIDLRIGHDSGLVLVRRLHELDANTRIVVLTGYASIATAVEAIKLGAIQYLTKPADADEIVAALHKDQGDATVEIKEKPLSVRRLEWEHLQKVLIEHGGNISAAARALGMHRRTLQRKLDKRPVRE